MKIEAKDLQSALIEASKSLECSVMDLEYEILQNPKSGFLGFGRKNAIIEVRVNKKFFRSNEKRNAKKDFKEKNFTHQKHHTKPNLNKETTTQSVSSNPKEKYVVKTDKIFDSFHKESKENQNKKLYLDEIKIQLENLLESSRFNIKLIELSMYDEGCVFIKLDGEDAALMIGKEAHRYKAISYLLHSWINLKYDLLVRLEIAEFLENQIQGMQHYLQGVIEKINLFGKAQTKPLDGVLIKIALEQLRAKFPEKYVGIKQVGEERIVVINDFFKKDE